MPARSSQTHGSNSVFFRARVLLVLSCGLILLAPVSCQAPSREARSELAAAGASPAGRLQNLRGAERLAAGGYDVVSYFSDPAPAPGLAEFSASYDGARYRFTTPQHRDLFLQSPARYAPAYGGWCATAMTRGDFVDADPTNFRVQEARLFLFYRLLFIDARAQWDDDPADSQVAADRQWTRLVASESAEP